MRDIVEILPSPLGPTSGQVLLQSLFLTLTLIPFNFYYTLLLAVTLLLACVLDAVLMK